MIIKKVQNKPIYLILDMYQVYVWDIHIYGVYHVYSMYILCIYRPGCDIPVIYSRNIHGIYHMAYTMYIHISLLWYIIHVQSMYMVYTEYICGIYWAYTQSIYIVYTGIYQVYTKYIPSMSNWKAWKRWKTLSEGQLSVDLGLCCHRVTFNLTINLYHDAWLMFDWSSVQCHERSNLRNQSRYKINRNKFLDNSELDS